MGNTILIVDDNPADLLLLTCDFRAGGFTVYPAQSCSEAIKLADRYHPDCFILDYYLGADTSEEICAFIRANEHIRKNPVIILSGDPEQAIHSYKVCQADVFVEKGRSNAEIIYLATSLLRRAEWTNGVLKKGDLTLEALALRILRPAYPPIQLSLEQFRFFSLLLEKSPAFVNEADICVQVFGQTFPDCRAVIWSLVYRLRQKLGRQLSRRITSRRNFGWLYIQPRLRSIRKPRKAGKVRTIQV